MDNELINASISGLKNVKAIMEAKMDTLDCTIETIEKIMERDIPDFIKKIMIATVVERYSKFNFENAEVFNKNDSDERLFLTGILRSLDLNYEGES